MSRGWRANWMRRKRLKDVLLASDWEARASAFHGRVRDRARVGTGAPFSSATQAELVETAAQWSAADAETHAARRSVRRDAQRGGRRRCAEPRQLHARAQRPRARPVRTARGRRPHCPSELANRFPDATLTIRIQRPLD